MRPLRVLVASLAIALPFAVCAQPAANVTGEEINHLFKYLEGSGCRFNRNGTWYDGPKAKSHLAMKYDYAAGQGKVDSAETFIELAATQSSMTGVAYEVQCPGAGSVPAGTWLRDELRRYRQSPNRGR